MKLFENNLDTKIFALGGLGEVGKNMYCIMHGNEIIIIDSGVLFPEDSLLGIDYVIPDFGFLKRNEDKIKGLFITHGHEDHIGSINFLLQSVNIPVIYAPNQAAKLIKKKLIDRNIKYDNIVIFDENTKVKFKNLEVEFISTTHSIPDSFAIVVNTPNGTIVETGDFKFDFTPIGPMADLHKMARIGEKGVTLLMSESTNALNPGMSLSESRVDATLSDLFQRQLGRIIIATFASNVYRLKHIIETCKKNNRKVAIFGRSMETQIEIALEAGYIKDKNIFVTPEEATEKIEEQRREITGNPQNLEEQAISLVGRDIYEKLIKGYTEKQWGRDCKDLPAFIIKRLPVRLTFDNNYFNALYQGIPIGGYTKMIANLLDGIEVRLDTDYLEHKSELDAMADKIVYTGPIDAYFGYKLGTLEYRSVRFETETLDKSNFQGNAAVNYTDSETPWTRIIEHKWFEFGKDENGNDLPKTIISREYSSEWKPGDEPYYPVNDAKNGLLYSEYKKLAEAEDKVIFGGRLGEYKYYDMDQVIAAVLDKCEKELGE